MMAIPEMEGAHGPLRDAISITSEIQQVLHSVGKKRIVKDIKSNYTYRYPHRVIEWVN